MQGFLTTDGHEIYTDRFDRIKLGVVKLMFHGSNTKHCLIKGNRLFDVGNIESDMGFQNCHNESPW
jgi:hypothetical protein